MLISNYELNQNIDDEIMTDPISDAFELLLKADQG